MAEQEIAYQTTGGAQDGEGHPEHAEPREVAGEAIVRVVVVKSVGVRTLPQPVAELAHGVVDDSLKLMVARFRSGRYVELRQTLDRLVQALLLLGRSRGVLGTEPAVCRRVE